MSLLTMSQTMDDSQIASGGGRYRGRLAPSPTGYMHLGHARTFWVAQERARACGGILVLRIEDLDVVRSQSRFVQAVLEDLRWFGLSWAEGPDRGGAYGPYKQSERGRLYLAAFEFLRDAGCIYACRCSRRDILQAAQAPHAADDEVIYPGTCRPGKPAGPSGEDRGAARISGGEGFQASEFGVRLSWRFRVPDGEVIEFEDSGQGRQKFVAGKDFGDFVVWRHDGIPSYQLAVVVDDHAMRITEVVRGSDLLISTARQLLLYRALGFAPPRFHHCPLVTDSQGMRLAKRDDALSLQALRARGLEPERLRVTWGVSASDPAEVRMK